MSQPQMIGLVIISIIFIAFVILAYATNNYSLNGIKKKTVGDGQHGTARWATVPEMKKTYTKIPFEPASWGNLVQGTIVNCISSGKKTFAIVDTDDVHTLMIASAGAGKTTYFQYPNIEFACASGMSFISTDTKGDVARNYGSIAKKYYGYNVSVIDLRNPTRSDENNILHLVNKYMKIYLDNNSNISAKTKAEKYAKITAKTIINIGASDVSSSAYGQNAFFYDAAEGLIASLILLIAEFGNDKNKHVVSIFKLIQDLLVPVQPVKKTSGKQKSNNEAKQEKPKLAFKILMDKLPSDHKARWLAGSALFSADQAMMSVMSTALSKLISFIDTEMEQILCFGNALDAEKFCNEKSAVFIILPEEDQSKYFMVSLIIQQLYREILIIAEENGGKLNNRVMFYLDEFGTLPRIEGAEMMFSASRSRGISLVPIIQSFAQLTKNYGRSGSEVIIDNTQITIAGGFAPTSKSADEISKSLGNHTVLSGSVSSNERNKSQSLQMISRPLMTCDELKTMPKGQFVCMKTGCHPMVSQLKYASDWGITFDEAYQVEEKVTRMVEYMDKNELQRAIEVKYPQKKEVLINDNISTETIKIRT